MCDNVPRLPTGYHVKKKNNATGDPILGEGKSMDR